MNHERRGRHETHIVSIFVSFVDFVVVPSSVSASPPTILCDLCGKRQGASTMSGVRVLVGTRKGAFILTSDGKRDAWNISGPHFAGWEMYHLKGSPADPNRLYASQSTGWFGQLIQRSDDGGQTWTPVGNKFVYDGVPGTHQ